MATTIRWEGRQAFYISGSEHDDTVRIEAVRQESEDRLVLTLPTLCITYADMAFANAVGGVQENYPTSRAYGPRFFEPPVEINGEAEIEKLTWIEGAERVVIGPEETTVEWWGSRTLVIPRMRVGACEKAAAVAHVKETSIDRDHPFVLETRQYADGRHTGGVRLTKRHPEWQPEPDGRGYDLWVRAVEGESGAAIPEAQVTLFDWDHDAGRFTPEATWHTDGKGVVDVIGLPCSDRKLLVVRSEGRAPRTWRFRPLPGQPVRQVFRLWQLEMDQCDYVWGETDTLERVAAMSSTAPQEILAMNGLRDAAALEPGRELRIPCVSPVYRVDARDTLGRIAGWFCYSGDEELAELNRLTAPAELQEHQALSLEGWRCFVAGTDDAFADFDRRFGLSLGWARPLQRTLHDAPALAFDGELVAVPTIHFTAEHERRSVWS